MCERRCYLPNASLTWTELIVIQYSLPYIYDQCTSLSSTADPLDRYGRSFTGEKKDNTTHSGRSTAHSTPPPPPPRPTLPPLHSGSQSNRSIVTHIDGHAEDSVLFCSPAWSAEASRAAPPVDIRRGRALRSLS